MNSDTLANQLETLLGTVEVDGDFFVVKPSSIEALAESVRLAHAAGVPVVPLGGATQRSWGAALQAKSGVIVQTTALSKVVEYEPADLTIGVEAGMTFANLEALLAANNQMLPLDAPLPAQATLGGILATAIDGPRRLLYGTARDLLIGIKVVEANGRISKAGGMVVKNVSGFDMMKLYLGSMGSLAIIVEANFKLIPRPRAQATVACPVANSVEAAALASQIGASQLTPAAVEYVFGAELPGLADGPHLLIAAEGLPAAVERMLRDSAALSNDSVILRENEHRALWAVVNDLPQTAEVAADELVLRLSCLPAEIGRILALAEIAAQTRSLPLTLTARALNGVIYGRWRGESAALAEVHAALLEVCPHVHVLAAPATLAELPAWGRDLPNQVLMQRIKTEFDPANRLNPGRFG